MRGVALAVILFPLGLPAQLITRLSAETDAAFEQYVRKIEPKSKIDAAMQARLRNGEIIVEGNTPKDGEPVPGGLIHDWEGSIFFPGATLSQTAALLQDFARHKQWYPEIVDSKLLSRQGPRVRGSWTLLKKSVLTLVLRAELDSKYQATSPKQGTIVSQSGPIVEIADYRTSKQSDFPAGEGHGFLWRFNGYWTLSEADRGIYAECRIVSLSRDVPGNLGWIVSPFLRSMPRDSLESTLKNTRAALAQGPTKQVKTDSLRID